MPTEQILTTEQQCRVAGGERIAILYFVGRKGFEQRQAHYEVVKFKNGERLSANSSRSYGARDRTTFFVSYEDGESGALLDAKLWVRNYHGRVEFVKNAFGDYVEKEVERLVSTVK